MRNSARKQAQNRAVESRLKTLEKRYNAAIKSGKKEDATSALNLAVSAFDKAAKHGVIPKATANRKKSRLSLRLGTIKPAAA